VRWPRLPNVPTFNEVGYNINLVGWNGIMAPAGTPKEIVERLSAEIRKVVQAPEGKEKLLDMGLFATGTTPAEMTEIGGGMRALVEHLESLGIELRDLDQGLVDFPGERDGQPVWLCWVLAEPAVAHWHPIDEGFATRRPW
jgi:hypothetical protein